MKGKGSSASVIADSKTGVFETQGKSSPSPRFLLHLPGGRPLSALREPLPLHEGRKTGSWVQPDAPRNRPQALAEPDEGRRDMQGRVRGTLRTQEGDILPSEKQTHLDLHRVLYLLNHPSPTGAFKRFGFSTLWGHCVLAPLGEKDSEHVPPPTCTRFPPGAVPLPRPGSRCVCVCVFQPASLLDCKSTICRQRRAGGWAAVSDSRAPQPSPRGPSCPRGGQDQPLMNKEVCGRRKGKKRNGPSLQGGLQDQPPTNSPGPLKTQP